MNSLNPVLLIENDPMDILTIEQVFSELRIRNPLIIVRTCEEAQDYLKKDEKQNPCLILLDLNLRRMNGIEFLKSLKKDPDLKKIPVVILSSSTDPKDKNACFEYGIAGYMMKSRDHKYIYDMMQTIILYWSFSEFPE